MIVIGTDPHMNAHTASALDATIARSLATTTVVCSTEGHDELLSWACRLGDERPFVIEDCRYVTGQARALAPTARPTRSTRPAWHGAANRREAHLVGPEYNPRLISDHPDELVKERANPEASALALSRP